MSKEKMITVYGVKQRDGKKTHLLSGEPYEVAESQAKQLFENGQAAKSKIDAAGQSKKNATADAEEVKEDKKEKK
jgi:hypothetical protein